MGEPTAAANWRFAAGIALRMVSFLMPLCAVVVPMLGLPSAVTALIGGRLLRPGRLSHWEKHAGGKHGYSNAFVRDPWFTVGNVVVEGCLRFPQRRREVLASRPLFETEVYPADCTFVAVPQPDVAPL